VAKNKINDLRDHLFAALEALQDKDAPMELARAKAISEVAQTIINAAKVECEYLELTGGKNSSFIPDERPQVTGPTPARLVK
jgi:hypothetical protein